MRPVRACCAAGALALALAACAGERPESAPATSGDMMISAPYDSFETAANEDLFVQEHARLLREIQTLREAGTSDTRMLETLALVSAGEEMYLQGRFDIAVKLLDEAARTLKPKR
jgi:hypothetical protein